MKKVLFLCTGNSCRSQMAEGFCRHFHESVLECHSAGIEAHGLNPYAVKVMDEAGIDISGHKSKTVAQLHEADFDFVVTVCGHADENCPFFPARTKKVHIGFEDPAKLANGLTEEEKLAIFRKIRDEIGMTVKSLPETLGLE